MAKDPKHEPHIDWLQDDEPPVLTDVVEPDSRTGAQPEADPQQNTDVEAQPPAPASPMTVGAASHHRTSDVSAQIDHLRHRVSEELSQATSRVVEQAIADAEIVFLETITEHLRNESARIIDAALSDFEHHLKQ